ncbi:hypothetical protein [Silvanigrella aquatica]|uniref:hypothetical protein n=1 Tax=Silvanigrella aquatica TaxID=1915309 RepID=UPI003AF3C86A
MGEFLKELSLTEGRGTGLPKIKKEALKNGSPTPEFLTDENRSFFMVKIPIHPLAIEINKKNEAKPPKHEIPYQYDGGHDGAMIISLPKIC